MKVEFRLITAAVIAAVLISRIVAQADSRSRLLNEDTALELLQRTLKRDRVYEKRISTDCISYGTEEATDVYFQFVVREIHNAKCGGDPETSPAIDRYRVYRRSGKIQQWEAADDKWQPYKPTHTRERIQKNLFRTQVAPAVAGAIRIFCRSTAASAVFGEQRV